MKCILAGAMLALAGLVAGCQTDGAASLGLTPGASRVEDELARVSANRDFRLVSVGAERLRVVARSRPVVIEPAAGLCIDARTVELGDGGVFAAISGCAGNRAGVSDFPGLVTVSLAAGRMLDPGPARDRELRRMRDLLGTVPGRAMLARGGLPEQVRLIEVREVDEGLYVNVEEDVGEGAVLFEPVFWRALIELNARLVLVTVSGFQGGGLAGEEMLGVLAAQVARLKRVNGQKPAPEERRLSARAAEVLGHRTAGTDAGSGGDAGSGRQARGAQGDGPERAAAMPEPARRPGAAASDAAGARTGPGRAPAAPPRPGAV